MITIYGIKNCDTMKKAFKWLDDNNIAYDFHDYKKAGVNDAFLIRAIKTHGWETIINKRGTTWRKLSDDDKNAVNDATALPLARSNPSIIKRPLIDNGDSIIVGFDVDVYKDVLL